MRRFSFGLVACSLPAFLLSLALTGCGGGDSKEKAGSDSKEKEKDKATSKVEPLEGGTGVIKGKVTLKVNDDVKKVLALDYMAKMKSASLKADDVAVCTKGDMSQQSWKVDDKGGVANVFVWVTPPKDKFFAVDAAKLKLPDAVTIDQPNCAFIPHVAWVMPSFKNKEGKSEKTKQQLIVKNSAPIGHNTKWGDGGGVNPGENLTIPAGKEIVLEVKPSKEVISLSCSIHGWMTGSVWAFDHPYVAITGPDGSFTIEGVPTGAKLNVVAWHEAAEYLKGKPGVPLDVKDGVNSIEFEIAADKVK